MEPPAPPETASADRLVLSFRSAEADPDRERWPFADDEWIRDELRRDSYLGYLVKVHGGPVACGDEWEEIVSRGCSSPATVVLRVEAVEGGAVFDEGTDVDVVHRREVVAA